MTVLLWDWLILLASVLGLWLLVSLFCYPLVAIWSQVRTSVDGYFEALAGYAARVRSAGQEGAIRARQELRERLRLRALDTTARVAWDEAVESAMGEAKANAAQLSAATRTAEDAAKALAPVPSRLKGLTLSAETLPDIPDVKAMAGATKRSRASFVLFVVASPLLAAIIVANGQMTSLVLSQVLPPLQPFLGLPVPLALAMALVLVEAALGLLHAAEAEKQQDTERTLTPWMLIWGAAGLGVVIMEAALYAVVDAESVVPLPGGASVFALMGAILGLAVFGLGRLWLMSLLTIRREQTPRVLTRQVAALRHAAEEWNALAEKIRPHQEASIDAFQKLLSLCSGVVALQRESVVRIEAVLEKHRVVAPAWAVAVERPLTEGEFSERVSQSYFWIAIFVLAASALAVLGVGFGFRLHPAVGAGVGLGTAFAAFALGAFATQATIARHPRLRLLLTTTLAVGVALLAALEARFLRGAVTWHGAALLVPALAAYLSGVQTGAAMALLQLPLRFAWMVCSSLALSVALVLAWCARLVVMVVEQMIRLLAWPALAFFGTISGLLKPKNVAA